MSDDSVFYYGCAWYPEREPEGEWERDLDKMQRAGLNTVRIAEFSWPHIEPHPGEFYFDLYDQVMARCEERGIWVVLGIDTVSPPAWLFDQYPDIHLIDQYGNPAPGPWPMHCFNHPGFMASSARYIEQFVNRYKGSPALVYYQLDNEPGYHVRPAGKGYAPIYCHCAYCQRAFRVWLAERYPRDVVLRAPAIVSEPGAMGELLWLEWRRFHDETNIRRIAWVGREVKRHDPDHPVTTNIMVRSQFRADTSPLAHDIFGMGRILDVYGMDYYTDVRQDYVPTDAMMYSIAARLGGNKGYHCLETQPTTYDTPEGSWIGQGRGFKKHGDDRRLIPWGWRPVAFGARSLLYWVWRLQRPNVWAIARPDGSLTEFVSQTQRLSDEFRRVWPHIQGSELLGSDVAIIHNRATIHVATHHGCAGIHGESVKGAFAACWEQRILPDILDEQQVLDGELRKYKVVVAPFLYVTSPALTEALRSYVLEGGVLFWDARSGSYAGDSGIPTKYSGTTEWGMCYAQVPANDFGTVMGYRSLQVYGQEPREFALGAPFADLPEGAAFRGLIWWDEWEAQPTTQVLARFVDGTPALVTNRYGAGRTYACAVDLFRAYGAGETRNGSLIRAILAEAGVKPVVEVSGLGEQASRQLEVVLRTKGDRTYLFALNANPEQVRPIIQFSTPCSRANELLGSGQTKLLDATRLSMELAPYEVAVVELSA